MLSATPCSLLHHAVCYTMQSATPCCLLHHAVCYTLLSATSLHTVCYIPPHCLLHRSTQSVHTAGLYISSVGKRRGVTLRGEIPRQGGRFGGKHPRRSRLVFIIVEVNKEFKGTLLVFQVFLLTKRSGYERPEQTAKPYTRGRPPNQPKRAGSRQ